MMKPIPGLEFSSVERHALPVLCNGFSNEYNKEWIESFKKHLQQYDVSKLEVAMWALIKQLAAILSRQCGIQYEFGLNFQEYSGKKLQEPWVSHTTSPSLKFSLRNN